MDVKERVIILRKTRYGEADLILTCMTPHGSKLNLIARAALKSKKRFGGGLLEPSHFVMVHYEVRQTGNGGENPLHTLKEAQLIRDFHGLRTDYGRLDLALHALHLMNIAAKDGEVDSSEMFNLLGNTLKAAETSNRLDLLKLQFEARLLAQQGVLALAPEEQQLLVLSIGEHEQLRFAAKDLALLRSRLRQSLREYLGFVDAEGSAAQL